MFAAAKRAAFMTAAVKEGGWPRMDNIYLQGKTLGIIGTGHIGAEMASQMLTRYMILEFQVIEEEFFTEVTPRVR